MPVLGHPYGKVAVTTNCIYETRSAFPDNVTRGGMTHLVVQSNKANKGVNLGMKDNKLQSCVNLCFDIL
jgi:hypothetical protein